LFPPIVKSGKKTRPTEISVKVFRVDRFSFYFGAVDSANNNDGGILKRKGKFLPGCLICNPEVSAAQVVSKVHMALNMSQYSLILQYINLEEIAIHIA
jgi:hypothetical protein